MRFSVIFSTLDPASMTIKAALEQLSVAEDVEMVTIDTPLITAEGIDRQAKGEQLIFASKHKAAAGRRSLTCHVTGNFGGNEYGGKKNTLSMASGSLLRAAYLAIKNISGGVSDVEISLEATHHGPLVGKPHVFMEIGSVEEHWHDTELGAVMAQAIHALVSSPVPQVKSAIGLGGTHYCAAFNKVLERTALGIGHVMPKYAIESLDERILEEMAAKMADGGRYALLDWKGLKNKEGIISLLDNAGFDWERTDRIG